MPTVNIADPYNRELIDDAYQQWRTDPDAVDSNWQMFFAGAAFAGNGIG